MEPLSSLEAGEARTGKPRSSAHHSGSPETGSSHADAAEPTAPGRTWPLPSVSALPRSEAQVFWFEVTEALRAVRRRALWPLLGALVLAAAAVLLLTWQGPTYRSSAQLVIDPRGLQVFSQDLVPRSSFSDVLNSVADTEIRLITSDEVLSGAAQRLAAEGEGDPAAAISADALRRQLRVQREASSYVVTVEAAGKSPAKAVERTAAVVEVYLKATQQRRRDLAKRTLEDLTGSLSLQRERLKEAEDAVETYRKRFNIVDRDGVTLNTELLSEHNRQLLEARNQIRTLAARLGRIEEVGRSPGSATEQQVLDSPVLNQLRANYAEATRELDDLGVGLGARHPRLISAQTQARSLRAAIAREAERVATSLRSEHKAALSREAALEKDLAALQSRTTQSNAVLVGLRDLEREAQAQRTVFVSYLQRERDLRQQATFDTESITVLGAPRRPSAPSGVSPVLAAAAMGGFGGLIGALAAILRDRLDGRVHSPARLAATGLPVLGLLPLARPPAGGVAHALAPEGGSRSARTLHLVRDGIERMFGRDVAITLVVSLTRRDLRAVVPVSLAMAQADDTRATILLAGPGTGPLGDLFPAGRAPGSVSLALDAEASSLIEAVPLARIGGEKASRGVEASLGRALSGRGRVVIGLGPEAHDDTIREFGRIATCILLVVEANVATYAAIEDLRLTLGPSAEKAVGALFVTRGRDPLRASVAHAIPAPHRAAA